MALSFLCIWGSVDDAEEGGKYVFSWSLQSCFAGIKIALLGMLLLLLYVGKLERGTVKH